MKYPKLPFLLLIISFPLAGLGQNTYSNKEFGIRFQSAAQLSFVRSTDEIVISYENSDLAVDIELVSFRDESKQFLQDIRYGAFEIAYDFGLLNIRDGGRPAKIKESYYVVGTDQYNDKGYPVFVIAILDRAKRVAYEITIDCYDNQVEEALNIIGNLELIQ